jgi:hypothetical protein
MRNANKLYMIISQSLAETLGIRAQVYPTEWISGRGT